MSSTNNPRVIVAEDHSEVREWIIELLREEVDIVCSAQNGLEAIYALTAFNPDILILDLSMPDLNGFQVARWLRESNCNTRIVIVTGHEDPDYVEAAWALGVLGYVLKSHLTTDLIPALHRALEGQRFASAISLVTSVTGGT